MDKDHECSIKSIFRSFCNYGESHAKTETMPREYGMLNTYSLYCSKINIYFTANVGLGKARRPFQPKHSMAHTVRGGEAFSKGTVGYIFTARADEAGKIPGWILDTLKVNQIPPALLTEWIIQSSVIYVYRDPALQAFLQCWNKFVIRHCVKNVKNISCPSNKLTCRGAEILFTDHVCFEAC